MSVRTIPFIEQVLFTLLDSHPDLANVRAAGEIPGKNTEQASPWVKITQLDAIDASGHEHLINFMVQFDCYAGRPTPQANGQIEAADLARTVRGVLTEARGQTIDGAVIAGVAIQGMARVPDADFTPARQRYVLTAVIHAHNA